jgi:cytochrome c oxidase subunit 3/cytochrome o ubiquinol oxidase subunit 3
MALAEVTTGSASLTGQGTSPSGTADHATLTPAQWGMIAFLTSEAAVFSTLIVVYLALLGRDQVSPTPAQALSLPLVIGTTAVLLSSSGTVHVAERALRRGSRRAFLLWWAVTIALGVAFLVGTGFEWRELITRHKLTISRNLFGTGYYTVVGLHALHVTAGVVAMLAVIGLTLRRRITAEHRTAPELVAWYWHFVDAVWVVVFTVIYVVGR